MEKTSELSKKQESLIHMMYNEDIDAERVMKTFSIDQKELETLVEDLVNKGFLRLTGDDELELTEKGKTRGSNYTENPKERFKEQTYLSSNNHNKSPTSYQKKQANKKPNNNRNKKSKKGIIFLFTIVIVFIFLMAIGLNAFDEKTSGEKSNTLYDIGDNWEVRKTYSKSNMDLVMNSTLTVTGEDRVEIDGAYYDVYVLEENGNIESAEMYSDLNGYDLSFVDDSGVITSTYYRSKDNSVSKTISNMEFQFREKSTGKIIEYEIDSCNVDKEISGGKPDVVKVGSTWSTTIQSEETETMTISGSFFEEFYGQGYSNSTTEETKETITKNFECLGKKDTSVMAGTFKTYEIRSDIVGSDEYVMEYFSSKIKVNVKQIAYNSDGSIYALTELISYDIS